VSNPGETKIVSFQIGKQRPFWSPLPTRKKGGNVHLGEKIPPQPTLARSKTYSVTIFPQLEQHNTSLEFLSLNGK
jgi:hypothetical protein